MVALGTGPTPEPIEHPLILIEPKLPWRLSGWLLIVFGALSALVWIQDSNDGQGGSLNALFTDTFIVGVTVSLVLVVCGVLILRRVRNATWVALGVLIVNALLVPFLPGNQGSGVLGDSNTVAFLTAICQGVVCGGIALIPLIFGLKKGEEGRF